MVLNAQLNPHDLGYVQTGEYYAKNGCPTTYKEEYYSSSKQGNGWQEDYCSDNGRNYSSGTSMQQMRTAYPHITTSQPSNHYVIDHEGYGQHKDGYYAKSHGFNDHDSYGYDKHSYGKNQDIHGYDKHSYANQDIHGYDKHSYGKNHDSYGYDNHKSHGNYSNEPNKYGLMSYYAEARQSFPPYHEYTSKPNLASMGAQWISKSLD